MLITLMNKHTYASTETKDVPLRRFTTNEEVINTVLDNIDKDDQHGKGTTSIGIENGFQVDGKTYYTIVFQR